MSADRKIPDALLVPPSHEEAYLEAHRIRRTQLPNGIKIFSVWSRTDGAAFAGIRTYFDTGGINDPDGKAGAHHLLEHLVASTSEERRANRIGASFNGTTSWDSYRFTLEGIANPKVRNYGVIPFLDEYTRNLKSPLGHHADLHEETAYQKKIVLREVAEKLTGPSYERELFRSKTMFGEEHPETKAITEVGGTQQGLDKTTVGDLADLSDQLFIPAGTTSFVYTQGPTRKSNELITDKLASDLSSLPDKGKQPLGVDRSIANTINPQFNMGDFYDFPGSGQSSVRQVEVVWLHEAADFSKDLSALDSFIGVVNPDINEYIRRQGVSYGARLSFSNVDTLRLCSLEFQVERQDAIDVLTGKLIPDIRHMVQGIKPSDLSTALDAETLRRAAVPMSPEEKVALLMSGINGYGGVLDIEKYRNQKQELSVKDLQAWQERLLSKDPAIFLF